MKNLALIPVCLLMLLPICVLAQNAPPLQDSTLNNLVHPPGYNTSAIGELGSVTKSGSGKKAMILVPGLGFGKEVFDDLISQFTEKYTVYSITPAGFGETSAPPMPDTGTTYAQLSWTNGIVAGILKLVEEEHLDKPVILAHFVTGTQVALNLALNHSDKIGKVVIIGGSPYRYQPGMKNGQWSDWEHEKRYTPEERSRVMETIWAPRWFKTVTKRTWDSNMWTPEDYCKDTVRGKKLFRASADVPLQVMIRYLIEWMAYDASAKYKDLSVPTLVLIPDFRGVLPEAGSDSAIASSPKAYLKYFHQATWKQAMDSGNAKFRFYTVPDTRLFMWYDNPSVVRELLDGFLDE